MSHDVLQPYHISPPTKTCSYLGICIAKGTRDVSIEPYLDDNTYEEEVATLQ
jgi:hypothetical protein